MEPARFLAGLAGASCEFEVGSAETFSRPSEFDVVLHFGTLYHLPSPQPLLSLGQSFENLKPDGRLPRAGDSGLRSSAGSQHLLFHAHAEQRSHQLLGVGHSGLEEKPRTVDSPTCEK
jgi:hypothetical protein